jgi:hypothetical protein
MFRTRARSLALATVSFLLCAGALSATNGESTLQIDPPVKEPSVAEYSRYLPVFKTWDASAPQIPHDANRVSTKFELRDFVLIQLTDSKTPYENTKAVIAISQGGKPASYLTINGFKNFAAEWTTEDVLKVETWPGRAIQIVQLIDVNDGKVLYSGAWNHIYAGPPEAIAAAGSGCGGHRRGEKKGELFAHIYGLEGRIIHITKTSTTLGSLSVKVVRNLPTALGWQPYDDRLGAIAVIHFDECLDHFSNLHLAKGSVVWIYYGQMQSDGVAEAADSDWGSSSIGIAVKSHGEFCDKDGKKVDEGQLFDAGR